MSKKIGVVIFVVAAAFVGYMLISGQAEIAWEKLGVYIVFAVGIAVVGGIQEMNQKKQDKKYLQERHEKEQQDDQWMNDVSEAAEWDDGTDTTDEGVVRMATGLRAIILFLLVLICGMVLVVTALAAADGAFTDPETVGSFAVLLGVVAGIVVLFVWLLNTFGCEVYYSPSGVTVRRGRRDTEYRWCEIGGYEQSKYLYIFHDTEGKRIFLTNGSYEGFDGFMVQYRRTHAD